MSRRKKKEKKKWRCLRARDSGGRRSWACSVDRQRSLQNSRNWLAVGQVTTNAGSEIHEPRVTLTVRTCALYQKRLRGVAYFLIRKPLQSVNFRTVLGYRNKQFLLSTYYYVFCENNDNHKRLVVFPFPEFKRKKWRVILQPFPALVYSFVWPLTMWTVCFNIR